MGVIVRCVTCKRTIHDGANWHSADETRNAACKSCHDSLKSNIKDLENRVAKMKENEENETKTLESKIENERKEKEKLMEHMQNINDTLTKVRTLKDVLNDELTEYKLKQGKGDAKCEKYQMELKFTKKNVAQLEKSLEEMKNNLQKCQADYSERVKTFSDVQQQSNEKKALLQFMLKENKKQLASQKQRMYCGLLFLLVGSATHLYMNCSTTDGGVSHYIYVIIMLIFFGLFMVFDKQYEAVESMRILSNIKSIKYNSKIPALDENIQHEEASEEDSL